MDLVKSFTYTLTKLDMLASKLSGSALILLLFNRLRKERSRKGEVLITGISSLKVFFILRMSWQSIKYEIYCIFVDFAELGGGKEDAQ